MKALLVSMTLMAASRAVAISSQPQHLVPPVAGQTEITNENKSNADGQKESTKQLLAPAGSSVGPVNVFVSDFPTDKTRYQQEHADTESNKWTDPVTLFTGALVAIGFLQWSVYRRQAKIMQNALRPRSILREAYIDPAENKGKPLRVTFNVENVGSSEATIVDSRFTMFCAPAEGTKRQVVFGGEMQPGEVDKPIPVGLRIQAGAFYEGSCTSPTTYWDRGWETSVCEDMQGRKTKIPISTGATTVSLRHFSLNHVYFYGRVSYRDALGITRNMAFYRVLDFDSFRFVPFGDPQLEYTDDPP